MNVPETFMQDGAGYDLVRPLFGEDIAVAVTDPRVQQYRVLPQEHTAFSRMTTADQRTFAAGRMAAHRAMARLGHRVRPVRMGDTGEPVWPQGLTGGLAVSRTCCVAAIAPKTSVRVLALAVGADFSGPQGTCRDRPDLAVLTDCAVRCLTAVSGHRPDETCFTLDVDAAAQRFEVTCSEPVAGLATGAPLRGQFACGSGLVFAAMTVRA